MCSVSKACHRTRKSENNPGSCSRDVCRFESRQLFLAVYFVRNGELLTAFSTTRSQNATTVGSRHALTETMLVVSLAIGTFFSLLYISILLYFESVDARAPYFPKRKVNDYSSSRQKNGRKMSSSMRSAQFSVRNSRKLRYSHSPFAKRAACSAMRSASSK